jgi:hypothetical protein
MAGIEAFLKGWVSRMLPQAEQDNDPGIVRLGRFGDVWTIGGVRKQHGLADEGSYFVTNNGQTAITASTQASFSATSALAVIANTDSAGNQNSKRIHLDYVNLLVSAAGSAASGLTAVFAAGVLDTGNRYASGGTNITANIVCPNMDVSARASVANVYVGALTAASATTSARTVIGQKVLRMAVSGTALHLANETVHMNFGGVEVGGANGAPVATAIYSAVHCPPIVIGPGQSLVLHYWFPSTTPVAASYFPELGWWER